ncbi:hypothetical protein [Halomonas sp. CSM-2]|uniref:hypothetical protein n=1 Tax=Halomonas sp. CSM-2 TaxID=1975722 RepID=UPI000A2854B0|nr:hypothetical protein [Halomonas sp. CSM-2]
MKLNILTIAIVLLALIFLLAGGPNGYLSELFFGAPEYPEIGISCELPLDWRYAQVINTNSVAVAGPHQGQHSDGIVIGIDTSTFAIEPSGSYALGDHICATSNIISVGKRNTLLFSDVSGVSRMEGEAPDYRDY